MGEEWCDWEWRGKRGGGDYDIGVGREGVVWGLFGVLVEGVRRVPYTRPILYNTLDMMTGFGLISLSKLLT